MRLFFYCITSSHSYIIKTRHFFFLFFVFFYTLTEVLLCVYADFFLSFLIFSSIKACAAVF